MEVDPSINWKTIAEKFEISGAEIVNVMYYSTLKAHTRKQLILEYTDILEGIKRELKKQDKAFSM